MVDARPEGVQAIHATCEQIEAAALGAMQMEFMLEPTPRGAAS